VPAATGKSVLSSALAAEQQQGVSGTAAGGSSSSSSMSLKVLNGDIMTAKGMRYWHEVGANPL
jgi:hypothetical protein